MIGWFRADLYWKACWIVICMHVAFFTSLFLRDERTSLRTANSHCHRIGGLLDLVVRPYHCEVFFFTGISSFLFNMLNGSLRGVPTTVSEQSILDRMGVQYRRSLLFSTCDSPQKQSSH